MHRSDNPLFAIRQTSECPPAAFRAHRAFRKAHERVFACSTLGDETAGDHPLLEEHTYGGDAEEQQQDDGDWNQRLWYRIDTDWVRRGDRSAAGIKADWAETGAFAPAANLEAHVRRSGVTLSVPPSHSP